MKGRRFEDTEEAQANATRQMRAITKSDFKEVLSSVAGMLEYVHTSTRTLLRRRQDQLADKSTLSLTKEIIPRIKRSALVFTCLVQK